MLKMKKLISSIGIATVMATSVGLPPMARGEALVAVGEKSEKLVEDRKPLLGFTSYAGLGGGGAFIGDTFAPDGRIEAGWQITPWLGLASFTSVQPLHDITDIVPQEESFARRFGTAISFTPYSNKRYHPLLRVTLGGMGIGYVDETVETPDDEKGYYRERISFAAGAEGGVEMNLSTHFKGLAWAGWRFVDADYLGLDASDFSRPELGVEIKATWKTLIY
jgi:hypothetical protein